MTKLKQISKGLARLGEIKSSQLKNKNVVLKYKSFLENIVVRGPQSHKKWVLIIQIFWYFKSNSKFNNNNRAKTAGTLISIYNVTLTHNNIGT